MDKKVGKPVTSNNIGRETVLAVYCYHCSRVERAIFEPNLFQTLDRGGWLEVDGKVYCGDCCKILGIAQ